jgi:hypothetical protein
LKALRSPTDQDNGGAALHLLYSVCRKDLPLLRCSLASVLRALPSGPVSITFLQDCASPLAEAERAELRDLVSCRTEFPISSFPLVKGPGRILSQLDQYLALAAWVPPTAWIVKLDTDILFLGNRHLAEARASGADLFGQVEDFHTPFLYAQGGCYFLRAGMVSRWARRPLMAMLREAAWRTKKISIGSTPEDALFALWTRRAGGRVELGSFYFEPSEEDWTALCSAPPERLAEVFQQRTRGTVFHAQGRDKGGLYRLAALFSIRALER